ncbi:bifunctional methylenetetrahydrofolate dehydrogenase/methenyltetrahydrofolate cyclohydrolase FolD [Azospirillum griseum]|uniref:Bifunctional protein FolD n=1 Tax=Azospirillum griseum TaxID=2496639 RepID=A0A3S0IFR0_9PROT|nr:bifunctional methylenetetrahydrofolate dehydrogenase/methenyltetrahydrofolate cyclohydrolase FolD [Azospirillum griseum]RTR21057.1 bifunctional methylenetetrahydrofolate dehydrogenase/methenyltetrahydrofolate cyclohydrolase FolD [Azospirillum griseum]
MRISLRGQPVPEDTDPRIIDGKAIANALLADLAREVAALIETGQPVPGLAVVLVGDDPASQVYVRSKARQTVAVGMRSFEHRLPATVTEDALLTVIDRLNADPAVDGILVQLPLPRPLDAARILDRIDPAKDVDGFHVVNAGRLSAGLDAPVPCTPLGCLLLLRQAVGALSGLHAVIVGRSNIVGKPLAQVLLRENCTVTIAHSRTRDLAALCRQADILVAAVGQAGLIRGDWVKPGATVIDVGINRIPTADGRTRLVGDVAFDEALAVADRITPVPGGVGPMTIACLLRNTLAAAAARRGAAHGL